MRGLIFSAMLAAVGCAGHRGVSTESKPASETAQAEVLDCEIDRAMERRVAVHLAARGDKFEKASKAWRKKAMQLEDDYEDLLKRCK